MKSSGFTLIELLVVVAIIGVLTSVGVASYNGFNDRQKVEQCAKQLKNNLRAAQSNAISGLKDSTCVADLDGWYANLADKTYYGSCGTSFPASKTLVDATCRLSATTTLVKFVPITGETNLNSDLTITVKPLTAETPTYTVILGKGGEIR